MEGHVVTYQREQGDASHVAPTPLNTNPEPPANPLLTFYSACLQQLLRLADHHMPIVELPTDLEHANGEYYQTTALGTRCCTS